MTFPWLAKTLDRDNPFTGRLRIWSPATCLAVSLAVALLGGMSPAEAIQDPPNCTGPGVFLGLTKNPAGLVTKGQVIHYTISLQNDPFPSCTASNIAIQAFCPDASGQSVVPATITVVNPVPNPLPVPTALFTVGTFDCTVPVNLNTGVTIVQAKDTLTGILNDLANANDPLSRVNTVSNNVVTEGMTVTKTCEFADDHTTVNVAGTVSNTGNDTLINLVCTDAPFGEPLTLSATTIPVGGSVTYSGHFTTSNNPSTDTVTCSARGQQADVQVGPESATATCQFVVPPPPAIPTLSGWVMIMLAVFLALVGATVLRRKPTA